MEHGLNNKAENIMVMVNIEMAKSRKCVAILVNIMATVITAMVSTLWKVENFMVNTTAMANKVLMVKRANLKAVHKVNNVLLVNMANKGLLARKVNFMANKVLQVRCITPLLGKTCTEVFTDNLEALAIMQQVHANTLVAQVVR